MSDLNNSNDSEDDDFDDETENYNEHDDENPSEMSVVEDLDTSVLESDYEDYSYEVPGDGDSVIYEGVHENDDLDNSFEVDFDNHLEEVSTRVAGKYSNKVFLKLDICIFKFFILILVSILFILYDKMKFNKLININSCSLFKFQFIYLIMDNVNLGNFKINQLITRKM